MVSICVNGVKRQIPHDVTVEKLIELFELKKKSIVLELNHRVVDRNRYASTRLKQDDTVEIVHFVGGG